MPSLSSAYRNRHRDRHRTRRIAAGAFAVVAGSLAIVLAIVITTTGLAGTLGLSTQTAVREAAGTLGGLGVPAVFLGVVIALPTTLRNRLGVLFGSLIAFGGVGFFRVVYPSQWITWSSSHLTFEVAITYFIGVAIAFWFVFDAVGTFQTRNDPQGTVTIEVRTGGEIETIEVDPQTVADRDDVYDIVEQQSDLVNTMDQSSGS